MPIRTMFIFGILMAVFMAGGVNATNKAKIHRELGQRAIGEQLSHFVETRRAVFISDYGTTQGGISFWRERGGEPMLTIAFPWDRKNYLTPHRLSWTGPISESAWQKVIAVPLPPRPKKGPNLEAVDDNGDPVINICIHGRTGLAETVERRGRYWTTSSVIANACDDDRPLIYWREIAEIAAESLSMCRMFVPEVFRTDGFDNCILANGLDEARAKILLDYRRDNWVEAFNENSVLRLASGEVIEGYFDVAKAFSLGEKEEINYPGIYKVEPISAGRLLAHFVIRKDRKIDPETTASHHAYGNMIIRASDDRGKPVVIDEMTLGFFQPSKR